jgi:alpha-beta hydrolase superfamily lysophospholipase
MRRIGTKGTGHMAMTSGDAGGAADAIDGKPRWHRRVLAHLGRGARVAIAALVLAALALVGLRACQSTAGPPLRPWHTVVPEELDAETIARSDWNAWVAAEDRLFARLQQRLQAELTPADRTPLNRYHAGSRVAPAAYDRDWNRSFVLEPAGETRGVVVLLHGLTDSPYSMRSLAGLYRDRGFVAVAPRMPGHGTVPAGLTREGRAEWQAAVTMAIAEARRRAGEGLPLHVVAYSNGAALALRHVLERIERGEAHGVDRLVLVSPMIEVSGFARYAGLAGLPAVFSRYARSAWLDVLPEYNPFKYNSFPLRAARESYLVTAELHAAIAAVQRQDRLGELPPILAFQSVLDDTVDARGVVTRLFDALPANGSELVLFDVNRARVIAPMLDPAAADWAQATLQARHAYAITVVGARSPDDARVVARTRRAGAAIQEVATGLAYPADVYSLSHVALPFPDDDPLYGRRASTLNGLQLGAIALRGERDGLVLSQDSLGRLSYNPMHAYLAGRIAEHVRASKSKP